MIYGAKFYKTQPVKSDLNVTTIAKGGYSHCIDRGSGYTLPNCVAGVHAQWLLQLTSALGLEKAKEYESLLCRNNAEVYWDKNESFVHSQVPKLGAIMVWEGKGHLAGHVMTVKEVRSNGDVVGVGSNYSGTKTNGGIWYTKTYYKSKGYNFSTSYIFKGFIYLPIEIGEYVTVPVQRNKKVDQIQISTETLNVRTGPTTSAQRIGYAKTGLYNVYNSIIGTDVLKNGTWYCIDEKDGLWVAGKYCTFLPKENKTFKVVIPSVSEELMKQVTAFLSDISVEFSTEEIK